MPVTAKNLDSRPEFLQTISNTDFVSTLSKAISTVPDRIHGSGMPIFLKGLYGQLLYFCAIENCQEALSSRGYRVENVFSQHQLHSRNTGGRDIRIRFAGGRVIDQTIIFRWRKGKATRIGVDENTRYIGRSVSPTFWAQDTSLENLDSSFNLWVIGDPTPKEFTAWLAFPIQWNNNMSLLCDRTVQLCSIPLDQALIDIIIPSNTSDYPIEFDELANGTDG